MTNVPTKRSNDNSSETQPRAMLTDDAGWLRRVLNWGLTFCWVANAVLLVVAFAWVYSDGRSRGTIELIRQKIELREVNLARIGQNGIAWLVVGLAVLAAFTMVQMFLGLLYGGPRFRSLRTWLVLTTMVAGWLCFIVAWPEVYWRGQVRRVKPALAAVEAVAKSLDADWPKGDGELPSIGPFLAYPQGGPTALMRLTTTRVPGTALRFSTIERTADGTIRFALEGAEAGAWLERRADDGPPTPFEGGLAVRYNVIREQRLAPRWYLVRYEADLGAPTGSLQLW